MKVIKLLFAGAVVASLASCNNSGVSNKALETELDSVSYALGMDMGVKVKANFAEIEKELFMQGFANALDSANLKLEQKDLNQILSTFFQKKQVEDQKRRMAEEAKKYENIKVEGEKFLEENKSKPGIITTESGLQYEVIKEGTGEIPVATSRVKVHYVGSLIDGTEFESSRKNNRPAEFNVGGVIKGWTEALQLMKVGSIYKLYIPQELAYGTNPRPNGPIKPYSALIFEVELLDIIK